MNVFLFPINSVFPTPTEPVTIKNNCSTLRQEIQFGKFCLSESFNFSKPGSAEHQNNELWITYNLDSIEMKLFVVLTLLLIF